MEVSGRLIQILEERSGVSAAGRAWKSQSFVIEINDGAASQYPRRMVFDLFGDRLDQYKSLLVPNSDIHVSFDIDAREYQGRWFNSIRAWRIDPVTAGAPGYGQQPAGFAPQGGYGQPNNFGGQQQGYQPMGPGNQQPQQPIGGQQPAANQAPAQGAAEGDSDLPF